MTGGERRGLGLRQAVSMAVGGTDAYAGAGGSALAVVGLLSQLAPDQRLALVVIGLVLVVVAPSRLLFRRLAGG